jgi:hypothetical protein
MDDITDRESPSRRGVLALLGAVALTPVAVRVLRSGAEPVDGDGLRVEVLSASRYVLAGHEVHTPAASLVEGVSWPDVIRVELRVVNIAAVPLLVSPGQFRLLVSDSLSVMPTAWRHGPSALAAGATRRGWIEYRAPRTPGPVSLEYTPAGKPAPLQLPLLAAHGAGS